MRNGRDLDDDFGVLMDRGWGNVFGRSVLGS